MGFTKPNNSIPAALPAPKGCGFAQPTATPSLLHASCPDWNGKDVCVRPVFVTQAFTPAEKEQEDQFVFLSAPFRGAEGPILNGFLPTNKFLAP